MKNFLTLVILVAIVVVGIVGGAIGIAAYNSTPESVTKNVVSNAAENLTRREELQPVMEVLKGGSVEIQVGNIKIDDEALFDFEAGGKIYFSQDAFYLQNLNFKGYGTELSADAYLSENLIYVKEDDILGGTYGLLMEDLVKKFENSIFAPSESGEYALPEETFEEVLAMLESMESIDSKQLRKDYEKLFDRYVKEFWKIAFDAVEMTSEKEEVKVGGERVKAKVVTIKIDDKAVAQIIEEMFNYVKDDDKLIDFLEKYEQTLEPVLSQYLPEGEEESIVDLFKTALEEAEEEVDTIVDDLEDSDHINVKVEIVTDTFGSKLMMLTVKVDKVEMLEIDCGPKGLEKTDKITVSTMGEEILCYEVDENTSKVFKASLEIGGEKIFDLDFDKEDESFKINVLDGEFIAKGSLTEKGGKTTFSLKKIEFDGEVITGDLVVIIDKNDKMPAPEKEKNITSIFDIDEEDVKKWIENIEKLIEDMEQSFYEDMEEQQVGF